MSDEVWSDIRVAAFSTIFNAFAVWLMARDWSVVAPVLTLAIAGSLAWYLLKARMLEPTVKTSQKRGRRPAPPSSTPRSPVRLAAGLMAIGMAAYAGWVGIQRVQVQHIASGLSWEAGQVWKSQCLGMKCAEITGRPCDGVDRFMPELMEVSPRRLDELLAVAFNELDQKGIIEKRPLEQIAPNVHRKITASTVLGRSLCHYYLTAYKAPLAREKPQEATGIPPTP